MGKYAKAMKSTRMKRLRAGFKAKRKSIIRERRKAVKNLSLAKVGKGFPKKMQMTHKYNDVIGLTSNLGSIGTWVFSANGMYDPDITSTGHQPMYFDQMSAIYDHYTVIGSKISVEITPISKDQVPVIVGCYKNDDATITPSSLNSLMEQTQCRYKVVNLNAGVTTRFSLKWSAKKTFGGSVLGNDNLQGTAAANPTEQTTYTFFCKTVDGVSTASVYMNVSVQYIAIWDELKDIQGS